MNAWNVLLFFLLVLVAFNALVVALLERAACRRKRAPQAGGPNGSPLGSPVRADEFMAEFDAELERVVWEWSRS